MRQTPRAARDALTYAADVITRARRDADRLDQLLRDLRGGGYPPSTTRDGPGGSGPADPTAAAALGYGDLAGRDLDAWYCDIDRVVRSVWQVESVLARWHRLVHPDACRNRYGCPDHADRAPRRDRCHACDDFWRESDKKLERTAPRGAAAPV